MDQINQGLQLFYATEAYLELAVNNDGWCRCTVVHGQTRQYLGADSVSVVANRLLDALAGRGDPTGTPHPFFPGHIVKWALSLAEAHSRLYVTDSEGCKLLMWVQESGNPSCMMHLSPERANEWNRQLSVALQRAYD